MIQDTHYFLYLLSSNYLFSCHASSVDDIDVCFAHALFVILFFPIPYNECIMNQRMNFWNNLLHTQYYVYFKIMEVYILNFFSTIYKINFCFLVNR